ncbi:cell division control protein [Apiospora kogelbergensis]|uniref:cell division control protein n=1 Tax=Apiospora kogelbergensis TaxID=1337665 RepID=UPI00312F9CB9
MAPAYGSNSNGGYGLPQQHQQPGEPNLQAVLEDIATKVQATARRIRSFWNGPNGVRLRNVTMRFATLVQQNLAARRLLSFPHLLVAFWMLLLLWGRDGALPPKPSDHRPEIVSWPPVAYKPLTMKITDNYMQRSYIQLQKVLQPDTVFFLGDLFDGGREWKTARGDFRDPEWASRHPADERDYVKQWNKHYGEDYWLREYGRFGDIFYKHWPAGGYEPGPGQRGRKIISSLPGNHDLGFGAEVKVPVRERFGAYFGEGNRVDVVGNHTFVSVDTVSLSADTSSIKDKVDLSPIHGPVNQFLDGVKAAKRRAAAKELRFWRGEVEEVAFKHKVEDLKDADYKNPPSLDRGEDGPDFPTILLTHVPLYRDPGTPCGPMREHWPPQKPPKGQTTPVIPDHRNAISVSSGYQYQNVLSEEDSVKLVKSIGNVVHAFSGDDHDYCELVHSEQKGNVREITVKSISMAMGVPTPGFQMVSLWNPIDENGRPLPGAGKATLQTHLCLLPKQLSTYTTYAALGILTLVILVIRAALVPILGLQQFALSPAQYANGAVLPLFKDKVEADQESGLDHHSQSSGTPTTKLLSARTRGRVPSISSNGISRSNSRSKAAGGGGNGRASRSAATLHMTARRGERVLG